MQKMKKSITVSFFLLLIFLINCSDPEKIYISPEGLSENAGTMQSPLNSIVTGLNLAKKLKADNPNLPVEIRLLAGEYHLSGPIEITPELSTLKIAGSAPGSVIIKGSKILNLDWKGKK